MSFAESSATTPAVRTSRRSWSRTHDARAHRDRPLAEERGARELAEQTCAETAHTAGLSVGGVARSVPCSLVGVEGGDGAVIVQELTRQASLDLLARTRVGRLACARGTQPYVVPIYFAYHNECLYVFSTLGQKIEWMRANPLVCVEADEVVGPEHWASVLVFGRYEELPDTPEWASARTLAHTLLKQHAVWWEPAYVKTVLHGVERALVPVFYRIHCRRVTGRCAGPEPVAPRTIGPLMTDSPEHGWLQSLLRHVRGRVGLSRNRTF